MKFVAWWPGKSPAKQDIELANQLGKILTDIVSREVGKLVPERQGFYRDLVQNKADAQGIVSALIKEIETSLNRNRDLAREVRQLKASNDNTTAQEYQTEISDLKWEHDKKIRECEGQIKELVQEVSRLESVVKGDKHTLEVHENEVQTLKHINETQRKETQRTQARHNAEKIRLQEDLEAEREALQREKGRMQEEHKSEKDRMQKEHESNQARLRTNMAKMKQDHDSDQKQMRKEADEEKARLKSEFEAKKAQLETAHAAETKRLRRDIEAYSEDLLARDDFKPMPDNDIKARFQDLAQEIDTLARLEWKPNQKGWTDRVLRLLSGNQRLLKKQILQDSVWVILHDNIFCSPFRVFGEEGRPLESQWNDEYGKG
jgi:chromosome segregation ATPase